MYSSITSRAGLVTVIFALLIGLITASPIPFRTREIQTSCVPPSPCRDAYLTVLGGRNFIEPDTVRVRETQLIGATSSSDRTGTRIGKYPSQLHVNDKREMVTLVRRNIFQKIKEGFQRMAAGIRHIAHKIGDGIKHVAQKIGAGIKHVAQKIGSGIKHVAQKIGSGIKHVAQKIGHGIKVAAQKVGHFIKTTGAKIAKFGLKIVATVEKVASKIVGFIPGVGKVISKVMDGIGTGLNAASNAIHVSLGAKLDKGMAVMDKARKIMGYIPRRRDLSELELEERSIAEFGAAFEHDFDYELYLHSREWIYDDDLD